MRNQETADLLAMLACDLQARPGGAPGIDDVIECIRATRREATALVIEFDPAASRTVTAFVEAERRCCADLEWSLVQEPRLLLRITGTPEQMDALATLFACG